MKVQVTGSWRPVTVRYQLFDTSGSLLGEGERFPPALVNTQVNRVLASHAPQQAADIDAWTDPPDGVFACYGLVLENQTNDPTTVLAK